MGRPSTTGLAVGWTLLAVCALIAGIINGGWLLVFETVIAMVALAIAGVYWKLRSLERKSQP